MLHMLTTAQAKTQEQKKNFACASNPCYIAHEKLIGRDLTKPY